MANIADEGAMNEFKASVLADRFIQQIREIEAIPVGVQRPRSLRTGAYIKYLDRTYQNRVVISSTKKKKSYTVSFIRTDPDDPKRLLLAQSIHYFDEFQDDDHHVIARLTYHFLVRYIERTVADRKRNALSLAEFKKLMPEIAEASQVCIEGMLQNETDFHQIPEDDRYVFLLQSKGVCPVEFTENLTTTFNNLVVEIPLVNFITFIACDESLSRRNIDRAVDYVNAKTNVLIGRKVREMMRSGASEEEIQAIIREWNEDD